MCRCRYWTDTERPGPYVPCPRPDAARIPIFAMTANAFAEDVAAAKAAGMNEHVAKPIDAEALYALLDAYFRGDKEE